MNEKSAVQVVDDVLNLAIISCASDIHLEQSEEKLRVRFRIDGVLLDQEEISIKMAQQVIARIKVLAYMDTAQKRIPQDGKFVLLIENVAIDLRVSTFPLLHGEKMVIRILDRDAHALSLDLLGFDQKVLDEFKSLILRQSGLFLVTGPTGSGKTTTLYGALSLLNKPDKNIITLEDPVEYSLHGITQSQINPSAGFTFEKGIRSLLRQDPDIIMIGEIRDKQTAQIAIQAALTGHLVLSTLHTNDAPSAVMRLMDMGIEPFLINASLTGVLAQRLARTICTVCKKEKQLTDQEKELVKKIEIKNTKTYSGRGCEKCNFLGYKGRTGIFELLPVSSTLRSLIVRHPIFDTIYNQARTDGMQTLVHDGIKKIEAGIISFEELARVVL